MPRVPNSDSAALQRVGAKEILMELERGGPKRYSELLELIDDGKRVFETTTTLANRLRELAILGLIKKDIKNNPGERVIISYEITCMHGKRVLHLLMEIDKILSESKVQTKDTVKKYS